MDRLLLNLPNITHMEVAVICVAAVFFCITPIMLAWSETRHRRRIARQTEAMILPPVGGVEPSVVAPTAESPEPMREWPLGVPTASPVIALESAAIEAATVTTTEPFVTQPLEPPIMAAAPAPPPAQGPAHLAVPEPPRRAAPPVVFRFQLLELRQARLADWPPQSVRSDAERNRVWQAAERLAATYDRRISTTPLECSRAVQATTLGTAEAVGNLYRLRFFLFDELWPAAATQAIAEAVFDVDPDSGPTRSCVFLR